MPIAFYMTLLKSSNQVRLKQPKIFRVDSKGLTVKLYNYTVHTPNSRIVKARVVIRNCNKRYVLGSIDRLVKRDEVVYFCLVEPFYKNSKCTCHDLPEVSLTRMDEERWYLLMKILLNIPTAAMVMQDATFQNICRFLSLGKTQSMLYSFFMAMVGYGVRYMHIGGGR